MAHTSVRSALRLLLFLFTASIALAQSGTLGGRVSDASSGAPLRSATVRVVGVESSRTAGAITDGSGRYSIRGLTPGRYRVTVTFLSHAPFEGEVTIEAGATATLDARLEEGSVGLGEVVVSASRKPEKVTEAPASVSIVSAREIEQTPALTMVDHLKEIPGVDIVQSGLTQNNVVARGFNNIFSGSLMTLTDNRIASVPSLRLNAYNFVPLVNEDIQQIELIRGPGAALYGPNTANGVLHTITRSPFSSAGTWLSLAAGERDVLQGMVRHAGTVGDAFGYKISAQYMRGTDWGYTDTAETRERAAADPTGPNYPRIGMRDSTIERLGGELRLDFLPFEDATVILAIGANQAMNNVDVTGVGAAQVRDWLYAYYQLRFSWKDLFVQAFVNQSDAGETFLLRTGEPIIDRSMLYVAQAQHAARPSESLSLTYGLDFITTTPVTEGTITGRNEESDNTTEVGAYLQGAYEAVPDLLEVVAALRADHHSVLEDVIVSPRAALVFTPFEDQTLRLTYNRAYSAPTTSELFLDILGNRSLLFDVRGSGVPAGGFSFRYSEDGRPIMHLGSLYDDGRSGRPLPLGSDPALWDVVRQVIKANPDTSEIARTMRLYADSIAAPPSEAVGVELRMLNSATGTFEPYELVDGRLPDRGPIRPTINQTIELGYKGVLAERIMLSVDLYTSHYTDFVGPLEVITPSVFYNRTQLESYLVGEFRRRGVADSLAPLYAAIAATSVAGVPGDRQYIGIPVATITPSEAPDTTAVTLTYRNYGNITLYGCDIGLQVGITDGLALNGSLSYVDKNFFENLDRVADLSLNAPKFKFSVGLDYSDPRLGLDANVRMRHVDGFPVRSGVYIGEVKGYSVVDLGLGYRLPFVDGLALHVTAQNLLTFVEDGEEGAFDARHFEFVGVPALGRLVLARLTYSFK